MTLAQFALTVGESVAAAVLLAAVNAVWRMSRTIRETTDATRDLVKSVAELQAHDRENRERVAVLWDREHWPLTSAYYPSNRNGTSP